MKITARGLWKNKEVRRHFETAFIMVLTVLVLSTEESTVSQMEKNSTFDVDGKCIRFKSLHPFRVQCSYSQFGWKGLAVLCLCLIS